MAKPEILIAQLGNPILRQKAEPINHKQLQAQVFRRFVREMKSILKETGDLGLAGNQVNQALRIIAIQIPPELMGRRTIGVPLQVLINPKIIEKSDKIIDGWEGCLSFNFLRGRVPRHQQVVVEALNEQGEAITIEAYDLHARVLQHEIDHLGGILYIDRMTDMLSLMSLEEFRTRYQQGLIVD